MEKLVLVVDDEKPIVDILKLNLTKNGYRVVNIDSTVLAQQPKLKPYIDDMRKNIADALGIDKDLVSVKATTEEGLGFTGEMKGIAAHAVCLIEAIK